ncbi:MAG TPA: PIN domain nuclease [Parvularcula sp.]|nr:PIN domain nuclease [Parvularcula sp.]
MNLLLDTNVALWTITDDPRLPARVRALLLDPENLAAVSVVSIWEIAIKRGRRGPRAMPVTALEAQAMFEGSGYSLLSIDARHAAACETLPHIHADPFDRMLVAQALTEPMRLVTSDKIVASYDASIIFV